MCVLVFLSLWEHVCVYRPWRNVCGIISWGKNVFTCVGSSCRWKFILLRVFIGLITKVWLRFTSCALPLECLLSVLVECGVSSKGSGPETGKGRVGFYGAEEWGGGGVDLRRVRVYWTSCWKSWVWYRSMWKVRQSKAASCKLDT